MLGTDCGWSAKSGTATADESSAGSQRLRIRETVAFHSIGQDLPSRTYSGIFHARKQDFADSNSTSREPSVESACKRRDCFSEAHCHLQP
jgi:hypothetical protein